MSSEPNIIMERVDAYNQAVQRGVDFERASVVLWLRQQAVAAAQTHNLQALVWAKRIDGMADAIKRGEHDEEVDSE